MMRNPRGRRAGHFRGSRRENADFQRTVAKRRREPTFRRAQRGEDGTPFNMLVNGEVGRSIFKIM